MVSQVEMGKTQPSVATLAGMAALLGVSLDDMVGNTVDGQPDGSAAGWVVGEALQRAADNPSIELENGCRWEKTASVPGGPLSPTLVTYEPGGCSSSEGKLMRHEGVEYAYLFEGSLSVHLDFDVFTMNAGDSLSFDAQRPHMYANHGDVVAQGLWTVAHRPDGGTPGAAPGGGPTQQLSSAVDVLRAIDALD